MEEPKFKPELFTYRGIAFDTHKEVYGFYCLVDARPAIRPFGTLNWKNPENYSREYWLVIPETLSIYTGCDDVDGNPIFINDIVETFSIHCIYRQVGNYPPPNVECEEWEVEQSELEVNFKHGAFCAGDIPLEVDWLYDPELGDYEDEEAKWHFEANWEDNSYGIRDEYPYLTWNHFKKPHIIGHTYDSFLEEIFKKKSQE